MEFINRSSDFDKINQLIDKKEDICNQVILIYANKGVGKSNFLKEVLSNKPSNVISLKIEHTSGNTSVSEHYLIQKMDKAIESICKNNDLDDKKKVLKTKMNFAENMHFLTKIISLFKISFALVTDFIDNYKGKQDKEMHSTDFHYTTFTEDYIIKILNKRKFWINIEDAHLLGENSISFLINMIKKTDKNIFFLELTCKNLDPILADWKDLISKCGITPSTVELSEFDIDDILKVAKSVNDSCDSEKIKLKYSNYNGNLKLVRLDASNDEILLEKDAAKVALERLPSDYLMLLCLLANYTESINKSKLFELINTDPQYINLFPSEIEIGNIECKISNEILKVDYDVLSMNHNTLSDILLNDSKYCAINHIAFKILEKHYRHELKHLTVGSSDYNRNLEKLLLLYGKFDVSRLLGEVENIKLMSLAQVNNSSSTRFLNQIRKYAEKQNKLDILREMLVDAYYSISNFSDAYSLIVKTDKPYYILMKSFLLYRQGKYYEAKKIIDDCIYNFPESTKNRLIASIIKLILLIVTNNQTEMNRLFNEIIDNKYYKNLIEYGYVLRLTEESDLLDSEKMISESVVHFETHLDEYEAARSKITLAIIKSLKGDLHTGKELLLEAKKVLLFRRIETYNILNNLSVIDILLGNYNKNVIDDLLLAESYATSEYDLFLIRNNILAYAINTSHYELAEKYYNQLSEEIDKFSKASVKCGIYYNFSKYHEKFGDDSFTLKYIEKIRLLCSDLDSHRIQYWKARLNGNNVELDLYSSLLNNGCHLNFSSNWWFSISYD